jgi:hypothetical protein
MSSFINFCEKKSIKLKINELNELENQMNKYYLSNKINIYKLNQIQEINSKYLLTIKKQNILKFKLLLTTMFNKHYCIFIFEQNNQSYYFNIKFRFNEVLFCGTLFDGEMVKNEKGCWVYYISDLLYYKEKYLHEQKFSYKLKVLYNILKDEYTYDSFFNVCHIQIKSYFLFNHLHFITDDCDIQFIPEYSNQKTFETSIKFNKDNIKVFVENQIKHFTIQKTNTPEVYNLLDSNNQFDSIACINSLKISLFIRKLLLNEKSVQIKCKYNTFFKSWIPII